MDEKPNILIVDDNISMIKMMSFILKRKDYTVVTAKDGPEAVERVKEMPFDVIFMDIKMPLMDGVETYRRIKKIRPGATVLMMTAYSVEDLIQEALQEGAYGIIYKPLEIEKIVALIEKIRETRQKAIILVVDDHLETCITLKNIITKRGYKVETAHTGEEAIAMTQEKIYGIIFIDIKLPTLSGLETYLTIRETNPEVVVIMMTGYRQEMADLVQRSLNSDAYTCLYKPLDMAKVLRLIDEIWERQQQAR